MRIFRFHPAGAVGSGRFFLQVFLRFLSLSLCFLVWLGLFPATASAYAMPASLRVGLERQFKEKESISITNAAIWVGYTFGVSSGGVSGGGTGSVGSTGGTSTGGASSGAFNGVFTPLGIISAAGGFIAKPEYGVCVQAPGLYTTYEQALSAAGVYNGGNGSYGNNSGNNGSSGNGNTGASGNRTYSGVYAPALGVYGEWLVYGTQFATETAAKNEAAVIGGTFLSASNKRVTLYASGVPVGIFDNSVYTVQIKDAYGGLVSLGAAHYRGAIELGRYAGQRLTAVNVLTVDEYLCSVVPSEMSPSFQPEALKAQAVAARSYTLTRTGVHQAQGYDLCDQSHCQNYQGAGNENAVTSRAVTDTAGLVATYGGQPINAVFFSSSGGATDDSENVWTSALPYLRSVSEISEYEPREWTRSFTMSEITSLLNQQNAAIGTATAVAITRAGSSGRVQMLTIYGTLGTKVLVKEEIRSFFSASAGGMLDSRNFTLVGGMTANGTAASGTTINGTTTSGTAASGTVDSDVASVAVTDGGPTQVRAVSTMYAVSQTGEVAVLAAAAASATNGQIVTVYNTSQTQTQTQTQTQAQSETLISVGDVVVFTGKGWGHGVGMSQRGAEGMARLGFDYMTILKHYYTGIMIE